jgi:hypothetical protein
MDPLVLIVVVVAAALFWVWRRRRQARADSPDSDARGNRSDALDTVAGWPPEVTRVLTAQERRAHALLTHALPDHLVLAQVPVSRFIRVPTRNSYHEWMRRVGQLCADLVVCDHASQVLAVVEVRRPTAKDSERTRKRHARMDRVLRKAGVRVIEWDEEALPHPSAVREQVFPTPKGQALEEKPTVAAPAPAGVTAPLARTAGKPGSTIETIGAAAAAPPRQRPVTTLEDVLEEIDRGDAAAGAIEPTPSTWFADLDSEPVPLDKPRR